MREICEELEPLARWTLKMQDLGHPSDPFLRWGHACLEAWRVRQRHATTASELSLAEPLRREELRQVDPEEGTHAVKMA